MDNANLLVVAMAEQCRALIEASTTAESDLPPALQPNYLLWMCDRIEKQAEEWPVTKLHRWIGFIQGGMLANHILDLDAAKGMFDVAKSNYGPNDDLLDHLDPASSFEIELGGES